MRSPARTLVLGVGNVLLGDEGVGIHAVRRLSALALPPNVELLDGGTGGFHLLSLFQEYDPIILIDATMDGRASGSVTLQRPRFASEFPRTLSAHDIGLRDLLESAQLLGPLPKLYLITISISHVQQMTMELSPEVAGALDEVVRIVCEILSQVAR